MRHEPRMFNQALDPAQALRQREQVTPFQHPARIIQSTAQNRGNAVKKREDVHKMADANKAFAHYRW